MLQDNYCRRQSWHGVHLSILCGSNKLSSFCFLLFCMQTIEDRILQLQQDKQSLANQALGTEAAKKMNKLSVAEILCKLLFMVWRTTWEIAAIHFDPSCFDVGLQIYSEGHDTFDGETDLALRYQWYLSSPTYSLLGSFMVVMSGALAISWIPPRLLLDP